MDIEKLDWQKQYTSIIKRIFKHGDDQERKVILNYYGKKKIKEVTGRTDIVDNNLPIIQVAKSR